MTIQSPYEILGVPLDANTSTIKRRYKELIRVNTPEHHPEEFMRYREAFETINTNLFDTNRRFPMYNSALVAAQEMNNVQKDEAQNIEILCKVVESPFNTIYELEKLLEDLSL